MENSGKKNLRLPVYILVGLVALQIVVLIATIFMPRERGDGGGSSSSFLPIWVAIFIPIILAKRRREQTYKQKAILLWVTAGLALLLLVGMMVFLLKTLN
jgi:hypothetical protein